MSHPHHFFSQSDLDLILAAIKEAESNTSGEIRVHLESTTQSLETLDRATEVFADLEMHKTELRNGVLFYLAVVDRKFAILGDVGINDVVHVTFWDDVALMMSEYFKQNEFVLGLTQGIKMCGQKLKLRFPHQVDDVNELSDNISFGQ